MKLFWIDEWALIWALKNPEAIEIPRGKIKLGTLGYWFILMKRQQYR